MANTIESPNYCEKRKLNPTLTIKGFIVYCSNKIDSVEKRFDWENALIDASVISAVTFFSTLGGGAVAEISFVHTIEAAIIAALSQFFVFLALKRGLIQHKEV